jgi:uncharacterized membrane protein YqjE
MENSAPGRGLLGSLRGLADGMVGSVHDRLQLLAIELEEEKDRLIQILVWLAAIAALGFLALIFASLVLVFVFWETARVAVVVGLAAAYIIGFVAVLMAFRRYLARQPKPFAATLNELQEDRACIREES